MASREKQTPTGASTPNGAAPVIAGDGYIPPINSGGRSHDPRWPLPIKEPIVYFASVERYQIVERRLLPHPCMARIRPGALNVDFRGDSSGMIGRQVTWGRVIVPVDWIVTAFGEQHRGYNRRLETRITNSQGGKEWHHCPIWQRPRLVGGRVEWERDWEGWVAFLERIHEELLGGSIDPSVSGAIKADLAAQRERVLRSALTEGAAKRALSRIPELPEG